MIEVGIKSFKYLQSFLLFCDRLFLLGLKRFGKGKWKDIAQKVLLTKTKTQIASHAQKFFLHKSSMKKRTSIHDLTLNDDAGFEYDQQNREITGSPSNNLVQ
uniref:Myb-like protein J n=1 Tax=Cajanus cajan TaxID=3821 RepID=A0A151QZ84_CAJCA|nr:Myb-like protein J [Cajanus cajan]